MKAKIALKLPRTNKEVEKKNIDLSRKTSELLGIDPQFGEDITLYHIQLTKVYKKTKGVKGRESLYAGFRNRSTNRESKTRLNQAAQ